jgi:putative flippase GtrA
VLNNIKKFIFSEVFKYLFIGGCTTLVNLVVYGFLCYGTGMGESQLGITLANVISVFIAILFAYITNKTIVFCSKTNSLKELLCEIAKFVGARLSTMLIEVGGVWLAVSIIGQDKMIGKLETQILVVIGNYFISKFFVFKRNRLGEYKNESYNGK